MTLSTASGVSLAHPVLLVLGLLVAAALVVLAVALWLLLVWRRRSNRGDATDEVPSPTPASEEPLLACGPSVRP